MPRSAFDGGDVLGEYEVNHKGEDVSKVRYIPCVYWEFNQNENTLIEVEGAFPSKWFSTNFRYVGTPAVPNWKLASNWQNGKETQAFAGNLKSMLTNKVAPNFTLGEWVERDISRYYIDAQCKLNHCSFNNGKLSFSK